VSHVLPSCLLLASGLVLLKQGEEGAGSVWWEGMHPTNQFLLGEVRQKKEPPTNHFII